MGTQNFNARVRSKRDAEFAWESENPVLLDGESIIVDLPSGGIRRKTGDGIKTYTQLPFEDADLWNAIYALRLFDTESAYETLEVTNIASAGCELDITLSSEAYSDFSGVTVVLTSENSEPQSATANADGSVTGLVAEPSFALYLETTSDKSEILITCTYQLDLEQVLHDYILHVKIDNTGGESSGGGTISIELDSTLSKEGMAAEASAVGKAIDVLENQIEDLTIQVNDTNEVIDGLEQRLENTITSPSSASVGQTVVVKAVDGNGAPTEWEAVDFVTEVDTSLTKTGVAADAKATGDKVSQLSELVGDTPVSEQIEEAINGIDFPDSSVESINGKTGVVQLTASDVGALPVSTKIPSVDGLASEQFVTDQIAEAIVEVYVQDEAPTDAPEGSIWVDTANDGLCNSAIVPNIHVKHITGDSDTSSVDFSEFAIGDIILVTQS